MITLNINSHMCSKIFRYYLFKLSHAFGHHLASEFDDVFDRRVLFYWFHIIRNSLYHPSRLFTSPPCFMWLCPFLIRVTDRRSAEKDRENERETRDFVTGVFVHIWMLTFGWVWTVIFPIDWKPMPAPPTLSLFHPTCPKWFVIPSVPNTHLLDKLVQKLRKVKYPTDVCGATAYHVIRSALIHTLVSAGLCLFNTDGSSQCNYCGQWVW